MCGGLFLKQSKGMYGDETPLEIETELVNP